MIKELNIEPYKNSLEKVSTFLDNFEFKKVKTKGNKKFESMSLKKLNSSNMFNINIRE